MFSRIWICVAATLVCGVGVAQLKLEGVLTAKGDGSAIPFATIGVVSKGVGTITNMDGSFQLDLDESLSNENLTISALGFKSKEAAISSIKEGASITFTLEELVTELDEVMVTAERGSRVRAKQRDVGNRYFNTGTMRLDTDKNGGAMALLVEHEEAPFIVSQARVRIRSNSLPSFKVRARVFSKNARTGLPDKDLLEKSVILETDIKKGWLTFDLTKYNLWIDDPEFFIVFEWVLDQEDRVALTNQLLAHLEAQPESVSESLMEIGDTEVSEQTIKDFETGIWFGTVLDPVISQQYTSYYRLNNLDEWKPSAAILTAEVTITEY